jgi:hypothetical protein
MALKNRYAARSIAVFVGTAVARFPLRAQAETTESLANSSWEPTGPALAMTAGLQCLAADDPNGQIANLERACGRLPDHLNHERLGM